MAVWTDRATEIYNQREAEATCALKLIECANKKEAIPKEMLQYQSFIVAYTQQREFDDPLKFALSRQEKAMRDNFIHFCKSVKYEKLPPDTPLSTLGHTCFQHFAHHLFLRYSTWKPSFAFNLFVQSLERDGPHVVSGFFGKLYYPADHKPKKLKKINDLQVYYWEKLKEEPSLEGKTPPQRGGDWRK